MAKSSCAMLRALLTKRVGVVWKVLKSSGDISVWPSGRVMSLISVMLWKRSLWISLMERVWLRCGAEIGTCVIHDVSRNTRELYIVSLCKCLVVVKKKTS